MSYTSKASKKVSVVFPMLILGALITFLLRILLAVSLSQEEFGLFYSIVALLGMLAILRDLGLGIAIVKFISEFNVKRKDKLIKSTIVLVSLIELMLAGAISGILFLCSDFLALNYFQLPISSLLIKLFSIYFFLFTINDILQQSFQGFQKMGLYSSVNLVRTIMIFLISMFLLDLGLGVLSPTYAFIIASFMISLIYIPILFKRVFPIFFKTNTEIDKAFIKKILFFGLPAMVTIVADMIITHTDILLLTAMTSLESVALYSAAQPIGKMVWFIAIAFSSVVLPITSELWALGKKSLIVRGCEDALKYLLLILVPPTLLILAFPQTVINIFFGESYTKAGLALQVLSLGGVFISIAYLNLAIISGIGKPRLNAKITSISAIVNVLGNLLLIPIYGFVGAAIATSSSFFLILLLSSLELRKVMRIRFPWDDWVKTFLSGLIFLLVISFLKQTLTIDIFFETIFSLSIGFSIFISMILLLGVLTKEELLELRSRMRT